MPPSEILREHTDARIRLQRSDALFTNCFRADPGLKARRKWRVGDDGKLPPRHGRSLMGCGRRDYPPARRPERSDALSKVGHEGFSPGHAHMNRRTG